MIMTCVPHNLDVNKFTTIHLRWTQNPEIFLSVRKVLNIFKIFHSLRPYSDYCLGLSP